jgi:homogentisate 1,2-dioxygenase
MTGFGSHFATEAVPGALPVGRNSPQKPTFGLYTEQLSGTAFTAPRSENRRSWLYRMRPSAEHPPYRRYEGAKLFAPGTVEGPLAPTGCLEPAGNAFRADRPDRRNGDDGRQPHPEDLEGVAVHIYRANKDMQDRCFFDADGELLFIPQQGRVTFHTEMGRIDVGPGEVVLIPRGGPFPRRASGWGGEGLCRENHGSLFRLPELGPIGSNGLANPRDFETPVARFEDVEGEVELIQKYLGSLWTTTLDHSPLDVVAWHGNLAPCRYDLSRFQHDRNRELRSSRSVDLHRPHFAERRARARQCRLRDLPAALDGGRGHVPPALVPPQRDERVHGPHPRRLRRQGGRLRAGRDEPPQSDGRARPDVASWKGASEAELKPHKIDGTMAFMVESCWPFRPSDHALGCEELQKDYDAAWGDFRRRRFRRLEETDAPRIVLRCEGEWHDRE